MAKKKIKIPLTAVQKIFRRAQKKHDKLIIVYEKHEQEMELVLKRLKRQIEEQATIIRELKNKK